MKKQLLFLCLFPVFSFSQDLKELYQKADTFSRKYNNGYYNAIREIHPLDSGSCFWYTTQTEKGIEHFIIDPVHKKVTSTQTDSRPKRRDRGHWSSVHKEDKKEPVFSPDSTQKAYISEGNLWITDLKTHQTKQLSFDGSPYEYYSSNMYWSPDSKKNSLLQIPSHREPEAPVDSIFTG